jgi:DNA repair photolyase
MSVNPDEVIRKNEFGTIAALKRIDALNKLVEADIKPA